LVGKIRARSSKRSVERGGGSAKVEVEVLEELLVSYDDGKARPVLYSLQGAC